MKRKSNPWLALISLLLMAVLIVCICTGCTPTTEAAAEEAEDERFVSEYVNVSGAKNAYTVFYIITDTETGVRYLLVQSNHGAAITMLEEAPGEEGKR